MALAVAALSGGIVVACRNDVPRPAIPAPVPEVTRDAPRPQPIDPKKEQQKEQQREKARKARKPRVSQAAPADAGLDAVDLPPVPDAAVTVVRDAGQPLK